MLALQLSDFQGMQTSIAKKPYIFFLFFSERPDPLSPLDPHMSTVVFIYISNFAYNEQCSVELTIYIYSTTKETHQSLLRATMEIGIKK